MPTAVQSPIDVPRHHHLPELQSIRGLAAVVVLLHHCSYSFVGAGPFHYAVEAALNAHAAVILFYVLSGYVLTRSLIGREITAGSVTRFYIARVFRIYPALVVAMAIVAAYYLARAHHVPPEGTSPWFQAMVDHAPWKRYFATGLLGFSYWLLAPSWSITVELQASLLLPFIALAVRRGAWAIGLVIAASFVLMFADWPFPNATWPAGLTRYLSAFCLGAAICLAAPALRNVSLSWARLLAAAAVIVTLFFRLLSPDWRFLAPGGYTAIVPTIAEAAGAATLLAIVAARPVAPVLRHRPLVWLGDVSYSLYLIHIIIVFALVKLMILLLPGLVAMPVAATLVLMAATLAVAVPLAGLIYARVERPGIALGKYLVAMAAPRPQRVAA